MKATYQIVRTPDELMALKGEWTALLDAAGIASPFLTWEWMALWWDHYCRSDRDRRLAVVVRRDGGRLTAMLPGYVHRRPGVSTFALLGTEFESTDYLQAIEDPGLPATALPEMLRVLMRQERGIDVLHLTNILDHHATLRTLERMATEMGSPYDIEPFRVCPYIAVAGDWEAYLGGLSAKMRKNVRRETRRLLEAGAEVDWVRERGEVRQAVSELFTLHEQRFAAKETETGFRKSREPFHAAVSEAFFDRDILRLFRVRVGGRTVAALYCFEYQRELFYFQSGIDPAWEAQSVGTVLVGQAIKYAFERGLTRFDFMRGGEEYKFRWTSTTRDIVAVRLGVSHTGRAALAFRRHGLRAKGLVKRMLRSRLQPTAAAPAVTS